jgi:hypothetical protein
MRGWESFFGEIGYFLHVVEIIKKTIDVIKEIDGAASFFSK